MSRRKELEHRLHHYQELTDILSAMKNLSIMESAKLSHFTETQNRVVNNLAAAAADFHSHYPAFRLPDPLPPGPLLLIGSERGFCGDFNEKVLQAMERRLVEAPQENPRLILVGRRLTQKLEGDPRVAEVLEGPSVIEDLDDTLLELVATLSRHFDNEGGNPLALTAIYHQVEETAGESPEGGQVGVALLRPADFFGRKAPDFAFPPMLEMAPEAFQTQLVDEYLFAVLHSIFYTSLMAENRRRMQQMEAALQQMDKRLIEWRMRLNSLRQEEITEEIEEIMLSSEALLKQKL